MHKKSNHLKVHKSMAFNHQFQDIFMIFPHNEMLQLCPVISPFFSYLILDFGNYEFTFCLHAVTYSGDRDGLPLDGFTKAIM